MENTNIDEFIELKLPHHLKQEYPLNDELVYQIQSWRNEIADIISGRSSKKLFIVGPCSIHNVDEAFEYAEKLRLLAEKVKDKIFIVMRVYFEKPRTTVGWKGLINDPYLNNTYRVSDGLTLARQLLLAINRIGLPCGYEVLDTITPQYICDLISWGAIGARTTESQVHRQMVSGLSMPIGFKNSTSGDIKVARDAIMSSAYPHCFMGVTDKGKPAICKTKGNTHCHVILRGGNNGPNYYIEDVVQAVKYLLEKELKSKIMIDCSHGNSKKDYKNQSAVLKYVMKVACKTKKVMGVMIESNLNEGSQKLIENEGLKGLKKGISITDSCVGFDETEEMIIDAYDKIIENETNKEFSNLESEIEEWSVV